MNPTRPRIVQVNSFSSYHPQKISLHEPQTLDALIELVRYFYDHSISYCVMGKGISFDAHFINASAVISTQYLTRLEVDWESGTFSAQAGVTWGQVVDRLSAKGYLPLIVPTTSKATIGGSFNCNTYSRMTAQHGREAATILSFDLLLPNGEQRYCDRTTNADLFYRAIGSYGVLGIVLKVRYKMAYIGQHPSFRSSAQGFEGVAGLEHLMPQCPLRGQAGQGYGGSGAFIYWSGQRLRTLVTKHQWVDNKDYKPSVLHRADALRTVSDLSIAVFPKLAHLPLDWIHHLTHDSSTALPHTVDDAWDSMFWLDATLKSRALGKRLGLPSRTLQQSFALPVDTTKGQAAFDTLYQGIVYVMQHLRRLKLHPTMVDVGYLPAEPSHGWSASSEQHPSFLLSITFEGRAIRSYDRIHRCFAHLSQYLHRHHQARIHLTKNVCCSTKLLQEMYADQIPHFQRLRKQYDPKGLLRTQLMDRCFGVWEPTPIFEMA